jgi:O-antigen ligase
MRDLAQESAGSTVLWRCALATVGVWSLYSFAAQYVHAAFNGPKPLLFVAALVAASLAVLAMEPHRPTRALGSPLLLWTFAYLVMTTAWTIWRTTLSSQTDQALVDRYRSMAFLLAMVVAFDERRSRQVGRVGVVLVAMISSVVNVAEEVGLIAFSDSLERTEGRAGGLYGNPNESGMAIVFGLAVGMSAVPRALRLPVLLVAAAGIGATLSRSALLCLCVLIVVLLWRKELDLVPTVLVGAGVAALLVFTGGRLEALLDTGGALNKDTIGRLSMKADDSGRAGLAAKVWRMFLDSPWVGHGLATEREGRMSHNIYLSLAAEHGVLGLLLVPALLGALVVRQREAVAFALVFGVAGFFGHRFLEQEAVLLCLALAAANPLAGGEDEAESEPGSEPIAPGPSGQLTA